MACLWPEPPEYQPPEQTPPFLWGPIPTTAEVQAVGSGEEFKISVKLRSEDAGEGLFAILYLNYLVAGQEGESTGRLRRIPAGTLLDERSVDISWTVPARSTPGTCEQLSLVVSHESNFNEAFLPIDDSDVAILTWWLDINGTDQTVSACGSRQP